MDSFWDTLAHGERIIAVTGHFGSGKTEFCVSLAFALAESRGTPRGAAEHRLALADLDIENPFFRSRERQDALEAAGVRVYSDPFNGRNGSELQTISASVRAPLEDGDCRVLLDCGGDASGAMILNQFGKHLSGGCQLLCVVNPYRPGSDTPEKALDHIRGIESATGLRVTGLVANGHLIRETTAENVLYGRDFAAAVSERAGIPLLCVCCARPLAEELSRRGVEVLPLGLYMRESYLDKPV